LSFPKEGKETPSHLNNWRVGEEGHGSWQQYSFLFCPGSLQSCRCDREWKRRSAAFKGQVRISLHVPRPVDLAFWKHSYFLTLQYQME